MPIGFPGDGPGNAKALTDYRLMEEAWQVRIMQPPASPQGI